MAVVQNSLSPFVLPGLGPGIHDFAGARPCAPVGVVDGRARPGQDAERWEPNSPVRMSSSSETCP